jgi:uncharacterized protein YggU (UPF0235/DUF167 family)
VRGDELRIEVRLTPRAGVDGIDGAVDGVLHCRVAAAPVDGAANVALLRLLASELGVAASMLRLVAGAHGRRKLVAIPAARRAMVERRWPGLSR